MVITPRALAAVAVLHLAAAGPGENLTLRVVPASTAAQFGAGCLDGTPPGYYYRLGDPTRWKIHLRGGGWCTSYSDCMTRTQSDLGSSKFFEPNFSATPNIAEGFMDMQPGNPWGNWSFVFAQYCDGASWTGANTAPVNGPNGPLYFRGSANIGAVMADLQATFGLVSLAKEVVLSGTSAGGLATILTADRWQALLRPGTTFAAIADSGFFLNYTQYGTNTPAYANSFQAAFGPSLWNSSAGTVQACIAAMAPADAWQCMLAEVAVGYTSPSTRLLMVQSQVDEWSVDNILVLPCTPDTIMYRGVAGSSTIRRPQGSLRSCNASETEALMAYSNATVARVLRALSIKQQRAAAQGLKATDGVYLTSCFQHGATCSDQDWMVQNIGGSTCRPPYAGANGQCTASSTAWGWYTQGQALGQLTVVMDAPFPGDGTCQYSAQHGWC